MAPAVEEKCGERLRHAFPIHVAHGGDPRRAVDLMSPDAGFGFSDRSTKPT